MGATPVIPGYEKGYFIRPTILNNVPPGGEIARTEIFGPVMSIMHLDNVDDAIKLVNSGEYGNMACIFTSSGAAARRFRYEANAGNVGVNIGVAAPMAFFPSVVGRRASSARCMGRASTRSSSSPRPRSWWNAG